MLASSGEAGSQQACAYEYLLLVAVVMLAATHQAHTATHQAHTATHQSGAFFIYFFLGTQEVWNLTLHTRLFFWVPDTGMCWILLSRSQSITPQPRPHATFLYSRRKH